MIGTRRSMLIPILGVVVACSRPVLTPLIQQVGQITRESVNAYTTVLGRRLTYSVSSESLPDEPTWAGPGAGPPPLSMEQAVEISRREVPRCFPGVPTWEVRSVSLHSLCCPRKWYYVVQWLPPG